MKCFKPIYFIIYTQNTHFILLMETQTITRTKPKVRIAGEPPVIDGVHFPEVSTLFDFDEINNYITHLENRSKSLLCRRKIFDTRDIDTELVHINRLHNVYASRFNYLLDESKKEKKKIREQQRLNGIRIKKERKANNQKIHDLCVEDREKRQAIIQVELDETHAELVEKQRIRNQRLQEIEQELGIDTLNAQVAVLQKNYNKLNTGKLKCPHIHKSTSENPNPPHWTSGCKYSHLIACDMCGKTWLDEDYICS